MKNISIFFLLFLFSFYAQAQEKIVNGHIIIDVEDASPEGIYITNSRTDFSTVTDLTGSFSIRASQGDTLLIRSAFYESRRFFLSEELIKKEFINIHLHLQPILFEEAVITQKLTGFLDKDAKYSTKFDVVDKLYQEMGVNPDASKLRDSSNFKFGQDISIGHLNVEKLYDVISGDLRRRQNLYAYEGTEYKITQIRDYFGEEYFTKDLRIPEEKIREFIYFSFTNSQIPTYYDNRNFLSIMTELSRTAIIYLRRLNGATPTD